MLPNELQFVEEPPPGTPAPPPGARWLAARAGGEARAWLTTQTAAGLRGCPGLSGLVARYAARDRAAGVALLRRARELLAEAGARRVLGPLEGSTWGAYRLALPTPAPAGADPAPFFLEPRNPPEDADDFRAAGFREAARYESRIVLDLHGRPGPDLSGLARRLAARGVRLGGLPPERFEQTLPEVHALSLAAFADSPYFSPLPFAEFRAGYERLRAVLDLDLVLLARGPSGALLGFLFAYADPELPERVIVKTLASTPAARHLGIGAALLDELHRRAAARGAAAVIHALMHAENESVRLSARYGSALFRRYALYEGTPA